MLRGVRQLHALRRLQKIPLPRAVTDTAGVYEHVQPGLPPARPPRTSSYLRDIMPEVVDPVSLKSPEGVWYHVARSKAGNLPVYTDFNSAGGVWTEIRKITGNVGALRADLQKHLELTNKNIWVQDTSKKIIIKGKHTDAVKRFLGKSF